MSDDSEKLGTRILERLRGVFIRNAHLKLVAVLLTFALYLWVGSDRVTRVVVTPIELSVPADQVLLEPKLEKVKVTLEGRSSALDRFQQREDRSVQVELSKSNDGQLLAIPHTAVEIPAGLRVVKIEPSFVRVEMAEKQKKEIPIRPRLAGDPKAAYEIGEVQIEPENVVAQGPRNVIETLEAIPTEPIDLSNRTESFSTRVQLRPESPLIRYELDNPVEVSVEIKVETIERTLEKVEVRPVNTTYVARVSPGTIDVTVRGPRSTVEKLEDAELHAVVDLSEEEEKPPGTFENPVEVRNLPEEVTVVARRPKQVVVTTRPRPGSARDSTDAGASPDAQGTN